MAAKRALDDLSAKLFSISPRILDINHNKKFFNLGQPKMYREAFDPNINQETFE